MGYTSEQATQALRVAAGDLEQAVGFLLMGDQSQAQLADTLGSSFALLPPPSPVKSSRNRVSNNIPMSHPPVGSGRGNSTSIANPIPSNNNSNDKNVDELIEMGYSRQAALNALSVAHGDMDQAVSFLLMGESRAGFVLELQSSFRFEDDHDHHGTSEFAASATPAATGAPPATPYASATTPRSSMYHPTSIRANSDIPKMVATPSYLATPGAASYCACFAASKFLGGGVVTADFLNEILALGVELFRKNNSQTYNVGQVVKKYGKSVMRIEAVTGDDEPKHGMFIPNDLSNEIGLRKLLAHCRNHQPDGWQLLILEIESLEEAFCIAIPPKGTKNKFWYLDFCPRKCVGSPGAYARVHSSLLQLEESLEAVFKLICRTNQQAASAAAATAASIGEPFRIYTINRRKR